MQRKTLLVGVIILAVLLFITAALLITEKQSFTGAVINPPLPATEISLTDHDGQPFTLSSQRGKVVLIYFGYTNCLEECPLTMAKLEQVFEILGSQSQDVQVLMVTTDPARDNPQALKDFLGHFNPAFLGLTGSPEELQKAWKDYGVVVLDNGETHSNRIYVIDRAGNLRLTLLPDMLTDDIASDLRILLREK